MSGRGPQTYKKRQKEMQRKERQQEKMAKRLQKRQEGRNPDAAEPDAAARPEPAETSATLSAE